MTCCFVLTSVIYLDNNEDIKGLKIIDKRKIKIPYFIRKEKVSSTEVDIFGLSEI